jgi:catechol 2,3-dioxygenase-like lactoylglutathione lyase family enzyme
MKFNHLDLPVHDIGAMKSFLERHFDLRGVQERQGFALLRDDAGFALVLSALRPDEHPGFPRGFHIGFNVPLAGEVEALHARLRGSDVAIVRAPGWLGGALTFQCLAPGGVVVEIGHRTA